MVAVGLKAIFISIFSPLLIPPCIPPELFDVVLNLLISSDLMKASLCSLPFKKVPEKPEPISKPFVAGKDIKAFAKSASNLSKTGIPRPEGTFLTRHSITPPQESP